MYGRSRLLKSLLLLISFFLYCISFAQLRWDGEGEDGQWTTAANWVGDVVPSATDDVLLDNNVLTGSYIISLPAGAIAVSVQTLTITPSPGNTIEVLLPNTNTIAPAFTTTGPGYGLIINSGGIFRNASGAGSGTTISISDSIQINNGGRYIHNTSRSNVPVVSLLSKAPGTEYGEFEFDVPGGAGYIPSLTGRTYGTLIFSASTAGGSKSYNSTGSQPATIRGNFIIGSGVNFNVSFSASININGNYIQNGGTFNVESKSNNTLLKVAGNFIQNSGTITEDGEGLPVIELNGTSLQNLTTTGVITDSVTFRINNPAGITLQSPLSLPYKLELVYGKINTSAANLLTMKTGASVSVDSLTDNSFINGPLRVEGLGTTDHYLFPVGKDITMRWVALKNATGNFTVEFFKANPQSISQTYNAGIDHISRLEYWTIFADALPATAANIELSFIDPNSGGVTDMSALRVAQHTGNAWNDVGSSAVTGTAGSRGSVTSNLITLFDATGYFSLASSNASNPLPVKLQYVTTASAYNKPVLYWTITEDLQVSYFEIQASANGQDFETVGRVNAYTGKRNYQYPVNVKLEEINYFRMGTVDKQGIKTWSNIVVTNSKTDSCRLFSLAPSVVTTATVLKIAAGEPGYLKLDIINMQGQVVKSLIKNVQPGENLIPIHLPELATGIYSIHVTSNKGSKQVLRFVKR